MKIGIVVHVHKTNRQEKVNIEVFMISMSIYWENQMGKDTASTTVRPTPNPKDNQTARSEGKTGSILIYLDANFKISLKGSAVNEARITPRIRKLRGPAMSTPART